MITLPCLGPSVATIITTFLPFDFPKNALPFVLLTLQRAVFVGFVRMGVATFLNAITRLSRLPVFGDNVTLNISYSMPFISIAYSFSCDSIFEITSNHIRQHMFPRFFYSTP